MSQVSIWRPRYFRPVLRAALILCALLAAFPASIEARPGFPKVANFYIRNQYYFGDVNLLAKWDLLVLDVDTPPSILTSIRALNPSIKILAFIPVNGTYDAAYLFPAGSAWRGVYDAATTNGWWLYGTQGDIIRDHPGKFTTNLTPICPRNGQGQRFMDWFPSFLVNSVVNGPAHWDGLALDDVWIGIHWIGMKTDLNAYPIDANRDGVADGQAVLDAQWYAGTDTLLTRLKQLLPPGKYLLGNGANDFDQLNGAMLESFPYHGYPDPGCPFGYSWTAKMFDGYGYFRNEDFYSPNPGRINIVNAKWEYGTRYFPEDISFFQQHKRFTLVSCMLRDGYYSMDWDEPSADLGHNSLWWLPEYDVPIGNAIGPPYQVTSGGVTIWRRDYSNGAVVLNGSNDFYPGSVPDSLPPLGGWDSRIILNGDFWHADTIPPDPVTDLATSRVWADSAEVAWTNTGDDGVDGQASRISVRYSESPINDSNFALATRNGPGTPTLPPGQVQHLVIRNLLPGLRYYLAGRVVDESGNFSPVSNNASAITTGSTGIGEGRAGRALSLEPPEPNPSSGAVRLFASFPVDASGGARLDIIDAAGRLVRRLYDGAAAGRVDVAWDGSDDRSVPAPAGLYFAVLRTSGATLTRKIVRIP